MPKTERWKTYRARNAAGPVPDRVHGTVNGYDNYRCRCEPCRAAKKAKMDRYRKRLIRASLVDRRTESRSSRP